MHRAAEAEMAARLAREVVDVGVGILAVVAIARAIGEADEIAGAHPLAVQLDVLGQTAAEALRRGVVAQRFLHRVGQQRRIGDQRAPRVGEIGEVEPEHRHEAAERLGAGHDQRRRRQQHLALVELVAFDLGEREMRDEVVLRMGAPLGDHLRRIGLHPFVGGDVLAAPWRG